MAKPKSVHQFVSRSVGGEGWKGALDPAGFLSGDSGKERYKLPALHAYDTPTGYQRFGEGANLATALGDYSTAGRLGQRVAGTLGRDPSYDPKSVDLNKFSDWRTMGPGANTQAVAGLMRDRLLQIRKEIAAGANINTDQAMNKYSIFLNKQIEGAMKQSLVNEIDPSLQKAEEQADNLSNTDLYSATQEAGLRSRMTSQARMAASSNLARVSAGLGLGNMSNSPAAAALAAKAGEDADASLVSSLSSMGLEVSQANRAQKSKDIDLATRIAQTRFNLINGDSKSIISMQGDIASMIDALYSREQTMKLNQQAARTAGQGGSPAAGAASGAVSGAVAGTAVAPGIGTAIGGLVGGAAGYFGSKR